MVLNEDFKEFIKLLNDNGVKYLIVGGYAVALHGYPRYTKDLDFWIWIDRENAEKTVKSLKEFGFASLGLTAEDFLDPENIVQLGYPPNRIDLITDLTGLTFEDSYRNRKEVDFEGIKINFISVDDLITNKKKAGRLQDLADAEKLEKGKKK
ncbi:MAG: nucleotidyltransferase [Thermoflexibacter sp.]|nr:nucleotidyltransferase [Thermoflexibacter sp.]